MAPPCLTLTLPCHLVNDTLSPTCHTLSPTCHTLSHQVTQDRLTNTNLWWHPHVTLGVGGVTAGAPREQSKLVLTPCGRTFLHRKDGCLKMGFYLFMKILNWLSMGGCHVQNEGGLTRWRLWISVGGSRSTIRSPPGYNYFEDSGHRDHSCLIIFIISMRIVSMVIVLVWSLLWQQ